MARLKLHMYEAAIPDCHASLELLSENMKAYHHLAQAEIELGRLDDAYKNAQIAYELCSGVKTGVVDRAWERSLGPVTALVLRCKKEVWEKKENERLKVRNVLLEETCALIRARKEEQKRKIASYDGSQQEMDDVEREWTEKEQELRRVWESAANNEGKRREVPDWAIDNITFAVMLDPVMVSPLTIRCLPEHITSSASLSDPSLSSQLNTC
jgi:STIP1 homology and U-box containing protein 1